MTEQAERFDVAVIGSGPGGYVSAIRAAQLGLKVALVEKDKALGGTCLHRGCIPTKALLEAAHVLETARQAGEFGIQVEKISFSWPAVQKRKQAVVDGQARGLQFLMKKNRIQVFKGRGILSGPGRVVVTEPSGKRVQIQTRGVILATGSVPRALPHMAADGNTILNSDQLLLLDRPPASLMVLGAGAVGMEFASIFSRFGSQTRVIEMLPHLLPVEDEEISKAMQKAFARRKIEIRTGTSVEGVEMHGERITVRLKPTTSDKHETVETEKMLVAVGRTPNTAELGLESVGLAAENGFIPVDGQMQTQVQGIYAIGDIVSIPHRRHPMLAHVASHEGVVAAESLAGTPTQPVHYDRVPSVTYCEPEVASVGLTEAQARAAGHEIRVGRFPMTAMARARIAGQTEGFVKIIAEARFDEVLGVHIMGARATELIAEAAAALTLETTSEELVRTIHAHPTLSESVGEAAQGVRGPYIHL